MRLLRRLLCAHYFAHAGWERCSLFGAHVHEVFECIRCEKRERSKRTVHEVNQW